MSFETAELAELKNRGLLRILKLQDGNLLNFSTNDYLNLSCHPQVKDKAIKAIDNNGTGAGGSRLMAGNLSLHEELEKKLAELTCMESALIFGSGFLTNLGVLTALAGRNDVIFSDKLNHASLVDGAITSRAEVRRYRHCDVEHLADLIKSCDSTGRKIIVTDSVFSMNGDIAPLLDIHNLAVAQGCLLVVDEAHAIGVFGSGGGICKSLSITPDVITGTLSKALGSYGGFAACSERLRSFFINKSRSFIYTTGLPPASIGAALAALEVINSSPSIGEILIKNATFFKDGLNKIGFDTCGSASQIIPAVIGDNSKTLSISKHLEESRILAVAIRPPTVPHGSARLRFSLTLNHSQEDIKKVISVMEELKWK